MFVFIFAENFFLQNFLFLEQINAILSYKYVVGYKLFRLDIQKPRQMENAVRDI